VSRIFAKESSVLDKEKSGKRDTATIREDWTHLLPDLQMYFSRFYLVYLTSPSSQGESFTFTFPSLLIVYLSFCGFMMSKILEGKV
jgi:hypothetical protein